MERQGSRPVCQSRGECRGGNRVGANREIGPHTDWYAALHGIDAVVHLAARVHVMSDADPQSPRAYHEVNTAGTERLARAAADMRVKRLVYVSTIKVNGEETNGRAFSSEDEPRPEDFYAVSKWEAEKCLRRVSNETGLEHVIVRPPLTYGPGVKANFLRLIQLVDRGTPLPFASIRNLRSLAGVSNLADLLCLCLKHPDAASRTLLMADGEDVSIPDLIGIIASALGKKPRLFPFPPSILQYAAALVGKKKEYQRLTGSLQIDYSTVRKVLDWNPPLTMAEEIGETVNWYRSL